MPTHRSRTGDEPADEAGFTLLEILVSLAILSVSLATLLGIFSMSIDRARQSQDEMSARVLVQSLIAETDAVADPQLGARGGEVGKQFTWRVDLRPYDDRQTTGVSLASVTASVAWQGTGGTRSLTLTSLRTIPRKAIP